MDREKSLGAEQETTEPKEITLEDLEVVAGGALNNPFEPESGSGDGSRMPKIKPIP
jgi:hypothetical protein